MKYPRVGLLIVGVLFTPLLSLEGAMPRIAREVREVAEKAAANKSDGAANATAAAQDKSAAETAAAEYLRQMNAAANQKPPTAQNDAAVEMQRREEEKARAEQIAAEQEAREAAQKAADREARAEKAKLEALEKAKARQETRAREEAEALAAAEAKAAFDAEWEERKAAREIERAEEEAARREAQARQEARKREEEAAIARWIAAEKANTPAAIITQQWLRPESVGDSLYRIMTAGSERYHWVLKLAAQTRGSSEGMGFTEYAIQPKRLVDNAPLWVETVHLEPLIEAPQFIPVYEMAKEELDSRDGFEPALVNAWISGPDGMIFAFDDLESATRMLGREFPSASTKVIRFSSQEGLVELTGPEVEQFIQEMGREND